MKTLFGMCLATMLCLGSVTVSAEPENHGRSDISESLTEVSNKPRQQRPRLWQRRFHRYHTNIYYYAPYCENCAYAVKCADNK